MPLAVSEDLLSTEPNLTRVPIGAKAARASAYTYDERLRRLDLTVEVLNTDEQGFERMIFVVAAPGTNVLECGPMEIEFRFSRPLWPGNRTCIPLRWSAPETCSVDAAAKQGQDAIERLRN